ncbi:MAG: nucleotidyltransferase family protein [Novosphingobium sp.]
MELQALRRTLLALVGTGKISNLDHLSSSDWARLDVLAAQHRLRPLLHAQHGGDDCVPAEVRTGWRNSHRHAALQAMQTRQELGECVHVLADAGIEAVALKGAWLSAHAYPSPALRPMRDIDLLVPQSRVLDAYAALQAAGYTEAGPAEMPLDQIVLLDKHLPPLVAPRGTVVELHHRLWEPDGRLDHASPVEGTRHGIWRDTDGIAYLAPTETLAHLIVHAVYSHRLDCGPLLLPDIDYLLRAASIDWSNFWARANREGWRSGARLVLELVNTYRPDAPIDFAQDQGPPPPAELLEGAPDLLLQDLETRRSAGLAAAAIKAGPAKLIQRIRGRRSARGEPEVTRDMAHEGGMIGWAGSRAWRSLTELSRADVRRQSRQLAALSTWLDR